MKRTLKRSLLIVLALLISACCIGCGSENGSFSINKKIVCEVDGEAVTYDEYKYFFYNHYKSLCDTSEFSELTTSGQFEKIKSLTENSLRRRAYIMKLIDEYDVELTDDEKEYIESYVSSYIEQCGGETEYKKSLLEHGMTGDVFRMLAFLTFGYDVELRNLLVTGVDKRIDMTDEAITADITGGGFYRYTQIYFSVEEGALDTDASAKITEAKALLDGGMSFAEVAKECKSEWTIDAEKGMYIAKGEKDDLLESTLEELEVGEYSAPKWSGEGWHIFMRLPIDTEFVKANLYTVIDNNGSSGVTLADKYFARKYLEYIENESKSVKIEYAKYFENKITFEMLIRNESFDDID